MSLPRACGVVFHATSLPGPYGIGDLGDEAYRFVDFLHAAGQTYWQVLPMSPTGYGDSPYQGLSVFAGLRWARPAGSMPMATAKYKSARASRLSRLAASRSAIRPKSA